MATFRKRKNGWNVQIRRSGFPNLSKTFSLKSDAQIWAREIELKLERGDIPLSSKSSSQNLGDILSRYQTDVTSKKRGAEPESFRIGKILRHPICSINLSKLTSKDMAEYRDGRLEEVCPASVVMELMLVSHAIDIARKEWGICIPKNVVKNINKPTIGRGRDRRLECGEEAQLLLSCSQSENHWLLPLVIIAVETGMRRGELLGLTWNDIYFNNMIARLGMTKNGTPRDVPLSPKAIKTLKSLPHEITGQVFPLTPIALRGLWRRACKRAGIEDLRFHDLRHEATSRFFEKGLNVMEVAAITGHKDLRMLQRYTHLRAEDLAKKLG